MATYFVSEANGNDSNNGTSQGTAWKTLAKVVSSMGSINAGDTVSFEKGGTYTGTFTISKSGTSGNPITFNSYGTGNKPKFTGTGATIPYLVYLNNRSYVVIDGLHITDPTLAGDTTRVQNSKIQRAIGLDGSTNNVTVRNCTFDLVGLAVYLVGPNNTVENCTTSNLRMIVNDNDGGLDDYGANFVVISSSGNRFLNNTIFGCWAQSFDFAYDGGAFEFFGPNTNNNIIMYNTVYDCNGFCEVGSGNGGSSSNNLFAYNKLINNESLIYFQNSGPFSISPSNYKFYNNVIIHTQDGRLNESRMIGSATTMNTDTIILKNNIIELSAGIRMAFTGTGITHTNNIYKVSGGSSVGYTLTPSETMVSTSLFNNVTNPDPSLWDFSLKAGSIPINFGTDVGLTTDFASNTVSGAPDAGILEYQLVTAALVASSVKGNILCNGGTTTVTVSATGGTSPYTGTGTFTVGAGTYTYTVTDAVGATASTTIVVSQPSVISATVDVGLLDSPSSSTAVTVSATGGTSPYTFSTDGVTFQSSNTFNLGAGNYTLTVKDVNNCTTTKTFIVGVPANQLTITVVYKRNVTNKSNNILFRKMGTLQVRATGGTAPYTFSLNDGPYRSNQLFTNLNAGTYKVSVKDAVNNSTYVNVKILDCSSGKCI